MIEIWAFVVIGITYTTNPPTATDQINSFVTRDDCLRYMMTANEQTTLMTDEKHIFIVSACKEINPYNAHTPKTVVPDALPKRDYGDMGTPMPSKKNKGKLLPL